MKYLQVLISSEQRAQALRLLDHLLRKRLIFGAPVFNGPARFLWKNEIVEHDDIEHPVNRSRLSEGQGSALAARPTQPPLRPA